MATAVGLLYVKAFYSLQKQQQSRFSFLMPERVAVTKGDFKANRRVLGKPVKMLLALLTTQNSKQLSRKIISQKKMKL